MTLSTTNTTKSITTALQTIRYPNGIVMLVGIVIVAILALTYSSMKLNDNTNTESVRTAGIIFNSLLVVSSLIFIFSCFMPKICKNKVIIVIIFGLITLLNIFNFINYSYDPDLKSQKSSASDALSISTVVINSLVLAAFVIPASLVLISNNVDLTHFKEGWKDKSL